MTTGHLRNQLRGRALTFIARAASTAFITVSVEKAFAAPVAFPEAPAVGVATFANSSQRVRAILVHGETVYVGGSFRVTQGGVTKTNLAAFDLNGNLKPDFTASPNGAVFALATDGASLFVGGEFTRLGLKRRLAAVDLVTGAVNRRFTAHVAGAVDSDTATGVRALAVVTDASTTPPKVRLIVGGNFTQLDSTSDNRSGIGALDPVSGDLDSEAFTTGVTEGFVDALVASDHAVFVGGSFKQLGERSASLVALTYSGAVRNTYSSGNQPVVDLDYDAGSNRLFAGLGGGGNRVSAYDGSGANTRALWQSRRAGGDVQAVHYYAGNVYFGFHDGLFTEPDTFKLAVVDANTGALEVDAEHLGLGCDETAELQPNCWLPTMDLSSGGQGFFGTWAITHFVDAATQKAALLVGGDFTQIGGVANTRRFAIFREP
jgi:hypothetical protein